MSEQTYTGTVKWFNDAKGYGFITSATGEDIFVHWSHIATVDVFKSLAQGQTVEYRVSEAATLSRAATKQATHVRVLP